MSRVTAEVEGHHRLAEDVKALVKLKLLADSPLLCGLWWLFSWGAVQNITTSSFPPFFVCFRRLLTYSSLSIYTALSET